MYGKIIMLPFIETVKDDSTIQHHCLCSANIGITLVLFLFYVVNTHFFCNMLVQQTKEKTLVLLLFYVVITHFFL